MKTELGNAAWVVDPWKKLPLALMALGLLATAAGFAVDPKQLAFSYLTAFMFFTSFCLGGLFLVLAHHLFDASWSVPIRRLAEHLACLSLLMAVLYIPVGLMAPLLFPWMSPAEASHALSAKSGFLNKPFFYVRAVAIFAVWVGFSWRLRYWSMKQDETGAALCTYRMRRLAAVGIFLFAITLTLAAVDWMMSLQYQWFSTMYGVYYFAGSVWVTLPALYLVVVWLRQAGPLKHLVHDRQIHDVGVLMLAFTVFYAYIHFSQYLIIWNANLPEETFWYVLREKGWWWPVCMVLVFGHFLLPFLLLLRIDAKLKAGLMVPICIWMWLMHYVDMSFSVLPAHHPSDFPWRWTDLACLALIGGAAAYVFLRSLAGHPIYPLKDPRLKEALTISEVPPPAIAEAVHSRRSNV
jgi:hypothetical protein